MAGESWGSKVVVAADARRRKEGSAEVFVVVVVDDDVDIDVDEIDRRCRRRSSSARRAPITGNRLGPAPVAAAAALEPLELELRSAEAGRDDESIVSFFLSSLLCFARFVIETKNDLNSQS